MKLQRNQLVEVKIDDFNSFGVALAHLEGYTLEIPKAFRDEKVSVRLVKELSDQKVWLCDLLKVIEKSPLRSDSNYCDNKTCNICILDFLSYEKEIEWKEAQIKKELPSLLDLKIEPSLKIHEYRFQGKFAIYKKDGKTGYNLDLKNRDRMSDIKGCRLFIDSFFVLLDDLCSLLDEFDIPVFPLMKKGILENVSLNYSFKEETFLMNLWFNDQPNFKKLDEFLNAFSKRNPSVVSVYIKSSKKINGRWSYPGKSRHFWGEKFLVEQDTVNNIKYQIGADSIYYPNPSQSEQIIKQIKEDLNLKASSSLRVLDFFSGSGLLPVALAKHCKAVYAFEYNQSLILDTVSNSRLNRLENLYVSSFEQDKIKASSEVFKDDFQLLSYRSSGQSLKTILGNLLLEKSIPFILYRAGDFKYIKKDIADLKEMGYQIKESRFFDLMPRGRVVESIIYLKKQESIKLKRPQRVQKKHTKIKVKLKKEE